MNNCKLIPFYLRQTLYFCLLSLSLGGSEIKAQEIGSLAQGNIFSTASLNWPDGTWYVRAILLDDSMNQVGVLSPEISFVLTSNWTSVDVTMTSSAPTTYFIRFYRSNSTITGGDLNTEYIDFSCSNDLLCNASGPFGAAMTNNNWAPETVLPVELIKFEID
jgi:hypothetical protein